MAATKHFQLWFLVAFTVSALFLLARSRALDEQATWMRRRIGDPTAVRALYLRGGLVFTSVAVLGALTLTAAATWKPLAGAWDGLKPALLDVGDALQRFLPTLDDSRGIGGSRSASRPSSVARGRSATVSRSRSNDRRATTIRTTGASRRFRSSSTPVGSGRTVTTRSPCRAMPARRSSKARLIG